MYLVVCVWCLAVFFAGVFVVRASSVFSRHEFIFVCP